jgi:hypothetical protein
VLLKSPPDQEPNVSIVPCPESFRGLRDGHLFLGHFPALRTGLLSSGPSGTSFQRMLPTLKLTSMGGCPIGYVSIQICVLLAPVRLALPPAHFERNHIPATYETMH